MSTNHVTLDCVESLAEIVAPIQTPNQGLNARRRKKMKLFRELHRQLDAQHRGVSISSKLDIKDHGVEKH